MNDFEIDYKRTFQDSHPNIRKIVEWKFFMLDENKDGYISRKEIREFKNLIQNSMNKQRACGRNFFRSNDLNSDRLISKAEWNYYFFGDDEEYQTRNDYTHFGRSSSKI